MTISVEVRGSTPLAGLAERLVELFASSPVKIDCDGRQIRVAALHEQNRTLVQLLGAVESWLAQTAAGTATISLDGRSYTLGDPRSHALAS